MLLTTAILAAILVGLALTTLAAGVMLLCARRVLAVAASPALASLDSTHARNQRLVASLVQARTASAGVQSGAERALWAMTRFDNRAERLEMAMIRHRDRIDQGTHFIVGLGRKLDRLRSVAKLVIG